MSTPYKKLYADLLADQRKLLARIAKLESALRNLLPVACDGVDARDSDASANADLGQAAIEAARALVQP